MGLVESVLRQVGGERRVTNRAERVGSEPERAATAVAALGEANQDPGDTIEGASAKTGMDTQLLEQIRDAIGGEGSLAKFASMLDLDGDGNPLDDIAGMASGLFGKK